MRLGDSKWRSVLEGLREGRYQDVLGRRAHGGVWDMPCGIRLDTGNGLLRDEHGSRQTVPEVSRDGLTFRVNGGRNVLRWWVSIHGMVWSAANGQYSSGRPQPGLATEGNLKGRAAQECHIHVAAVCLCVPTLCTTGCGLYTQTQRDIERNHSGTHFNSYLSDLRAIRSPLG
jgi:hypothetical protein